MLYLDTVTLNYYITLNYLLNSEIKFRIVVNKIVYSNLQLVEDSKNIQLLSHIFNVTLKYILHSLLLYTLYHAYIQNI